jgi:hypothetical protein
MTTDTTEESVPNPVPFIVKFPNPAGLIVVGESALTTGVDAA